ncbi:hypothetical protein ACFY3M_47730 [Streptomyces mirabilis]|uniref:hypothetical protein n=1 Tax=Streptomyces mirabilis TaxID=68239 RepID=UPI00369D992A
MFEGDASDLLQDFVVAHEHAALARDVGDHAGACLAGRTWTVPSPEVLRRSGISMAGSRTTWAVTDAEGVMVAGGDRETSVLLLVQGLHRRLGLADDRPVPGWCEPFLAVTVRSSTERLAGARLPPNRGISPG